MGVRLLRCSLAGVLALAGCTLPREERPAAPGPVSARYAPEALTAVGRSAVAVARAAPPTVPSVSRAPAVPPPLPAPKAADALLASRPPSIVMDANPRAAKTQQELPPPDDLEPRWVAVGTHDALAMARNTRAPVLLREDDPPTPTELPPIVPPPGPMPKPVEAKPQTVPPVAETPQAPPPSVPVVVPVPSPVAVPARGVPPADVKPPATPSPGEFLPPIPAPPVVPGDAPTPPPAKFPQLTPPRSLPDPGPVAGPIIVNGVPLPYDSLSKLVDGTACPSCGGGGMGPGLAGCTTCGPCGDAPCRPGGGRGRPVFVPKTPIGRIIGLAYDSVCNPDPCYQPKWEPLADAAFYVDAVRPRSSTRFRWDYGHHFAYPDRGEYFFARADGNGKGPPANAPLRAIPYVDYHELYLITEIGTGAAGVQIAVPYRSVNSTPFGPDGAGFADMTITAKTMLLDSELALFGFQLRTYLPIGQPRKGLGTGHVSLEPGLNFGLRAAPKTYLQAQVVQWIPLGGDNDYQGAHLRWAMSINHIWWQPVPDIQLIGTWETTGISFQDGLFTDPALGPQRLAKRTSATMGVGFRLVFCDTFDFGVGWQHGITGKYLMRDQTRFEVRYRY